MRIIKVVLTYGGRRGVLDCLYPPPHPLPVARDHNAPKLSNSKTGCQETCGLCPAASTPVPTAGPCEDVEGFADEWGYGCSGWAGYDCIGGSEWGYSADGMVGIRAGCQETCGLCPTAPTPAPTAGPCEDTGGFLDSQGGACLSWSGCDCMGGSEGGYSTDDMTDVRANCAATCGLCSNFVPSVAPTANPNIGEVPPPSCGDTDGFVDMFGSGCSGWAGYDCLDLDQALGWGYSAEIMSDVLSSCAATCETCAVAVQGAVVLSGISVAEFNITV
jgi:hypothetical protein